MLEHLIQYLTDRSLGQMARDAVDILLVYYVSYRALLVLRGTRAMQVGLGLALVFVFFLVAQWLQLVTVVSILGELITSIILVIVVVFQNDIRRGLMRVGSRAWLSGWSRARETKVIDEVVEAATELARHRIGAIITFEQEANLDEFVGSNKGINIDAEMSSELLVSLFIPEGMNKLHDGAVIVRNLRIAKAGVFFPMPEGKVIDASFGSRHRASIGITEETDAVVVVVSEERGTISFVFNGNIASNLDGPKLRAMLEAIFSPKFRSKKPKKDRRSTLPSVISEAVAETETEPEAVPVEETPEPPESEPRARESEAPPAPLRQRPVAEETPPPSRATSIRTPV
ncbi:MAG TPA: diadenylate cyclase CdaA, partial [Polyangiaceae bacterium]|nr:diadenylate cyclase CdaA [Polyangiaceae bacterium]